MLIFIVHTRVGGEVSWEGGGDERDLIWLRNEVQSEREREEKT